MTLEYKNEITTDEAIELDLKIFHAIKNYRLQSLNKIGVEVIIDRLNLEPFYNLFSSFNAGNDLPYHNLYHAHCVLLNCYEGGMHSRLSDDELRGLCAGALFHDFNHFGGILPDDKNIEVALEGLKIAQRYAVSQHLGLSDASLKIAEAVIKVTQYPYIIEPTTIPEQIIRDADLMQAYEDTPKELQKQFFGLKVELEVNGNKISTVDFAKGIKEFHEKISWNSQWAIEKVSVRNFYQAVVELVKLVSGGDK